MIFRALLRIPVFGPLLAIVNSYVGGGDFSSDERPAPFFAWLKTLTPGLTLAFALTALIMADCTWSLKDMSCSLKNAGFAGTSGTIATTVLPNILGFGIGVYALIFSLSAGFVKLFHKAAQAARAKGKRISVLALNADMAFPLIVVLIAIIVGVLQQRFPASLWLCTLSWTLLWYALIVTMDLVAAIYRLGEHSLLDKVEND